jgi:hypothetical protein
MIQSSSEKGQKKDTFSFAFVTGSTTHAFPYAVSIVPFFRQEFNILNDPSGPSLYAALLSVQPF